MPQNTHIHHQFLYSCSIPFFPKNAYKYYFFVVHCDCWFQNIGTDGTEYNWMFCSEVPGLHDNHLSLPGNFWPDTSKQQATCWALFLPRNSCVLTWTWKVLHPSSTLFQSDQFLAPTITTTANWDLGEFLNELADGSTAYLVKSQLQGDPSLIAFRALPDNIWRVS